MVKLTEVEDEHFSEERATTKHDELLASDDEDYTDTDSEVSSVSDFPSSYAAAADETLTERLLALRDIIPPKARAQISSTTSTLYHATSAGITYGGKGLWIVATSILLLGIPYALALGQEQELMEEERQRGMMEQGASGILQPSDGDVKPAL